MTTQQPDALAADHSGDATDMVGRWYMLNKMGMATLCANKADAQQEAADAQRFWPHMGPHRAVQLVEVADVEALRTGYAAARLEIESLRMRAGGALDAVLHEAVSAIYFDDSSKFKSALGCIVRTIDPALAGELLCHPKAAFDKSQARLDADRAMRAAQPAGAQQPGAATWALPDADSDYMRKVVAVAVAMLFDGYKEDVTRVFSTGELSEFVTITAAMGGERVEDIYRRAWDLLSLPVRASHGQAPVQAAPAAVAVPTFEDFCKRHGLDPKKMDGHGGMWARVALDECRAITTQPAPQQEAQYDHGPQAETVAEAARDVGKWLNERPNRPIDLRHVAMLCAHAQAAPQQDAQEPMAVPRFNCWSTNEGDSWFDHPADSQAIYDCLGNDAKVGDEYELTAGWRSVTARYRITEVVGDGEEYEVECISHRQENTAPQADSVLEDAARLEFEMQHGSAIDAARKQGANHD